MRPMDSYACASPQSCSFIYLSTTLPMRFGKMFEELYRKQDEMKGHLLIVELLSLDPRNYDKIQDFFTKYNDLLL